MARGGAVAVRVAALVLGLLAHRGAAVSTANPGSSASPGGLPPCAAVKVGLLQLAQQAPFDAVSVATHRAVALGAHVVVAPEGVASGREELASFANLAADARVAVVATFFEASARAAPARKSGVSGVNGVNGSTTNAVLFDRQGRAVLEYSKPAGTFAAPTAGANRSVATLMTANCSVAVAITLGFDYLFPETVRSVMPLGAQVVLNPVSHAITDTDVKHTHVLAYDNRVFIATANYAAPPPVRSRANGNGDGDGDGGELVHHLGTVAPEDVPNGRSGLTSILTATRPIGGDTLAGSAPGEVIFIAAIADMPKSISGDANRKPYRYRHLCFDGEDGDGSEKGRDHREPPAEGGGSGGSDGVDQTVTVAMLQMAPAPLSANSVELNADKAERFARRAKAQGADVALMAEQFLVGYTATFPGFGYADVKTLPTEDILRYSDQSVAEDGPTMTRFKALARELDMAIAVSHLQTPAAPVGRAAALGGLPPYNSVTLIDRFGDMAYTYSKVHTCIWTDDESLTTPGHSFFAASVSIRPGFNVTAGSFICYDRTFPEAARSVMMAGAELFLAPTACTIGDYDHDTVAARARENAAAAVLVNFASDPAGGVPPDHLNGANGNSVASDHLGNFVAVGASSPNATAEGVYLARLDIGAVRAYRATQRGRALTSPHKHPVLCRLWKRQGDDPDESAYGRNVAPF